MALTVIVIDSAQDTGSLLFSDWGDGRVSAELERLLAGLVTGAYSGTISVAPGAVYATGTLTISGGSGAVGGTINGTLKTVTWATDDATTAAALAAAINADTTLNKWVIASASGGVVTLKGAVPGAIGNAITLVASGTGVTASGAKLGAGTGVTGTGAPSQNVWVA